jgi:hypothetical protein
MTVILSRNSEMGMNAVFTLSIFTSPEEGTRSLLIAVEIELFPAPVLPTIPIFSPDLMW